LLQSCRASRRSPATATYHEKAINSVFFFTKKPIGRRIRGHGHGTHRRLPAAVESYRRAIQLDPGLSQARFNLALARVREGRVAEAVEHLREAVRIEPKHGAGFITRTLAWAEDGRLDEARRALEAAAQVPERPWSRASISACWP